MYAEATKVCPAGMHGCGRRLPLSHFYRRSGSVDGLQGYCKDCQRKCKADKRANNPGFRSIEARREKYGLASDEVVSFLQVPVCQSCGKPFDSSHSQKFDHCHELGHVRGVICHACNLACAGTSEVAMSRLQLCVEYLRRDIEREQARTN